MNYYVIIPSLDVKIIGHFPQVKEIKQNCDVWNEPNFIEHLHFEKADFEPITSNAILYSKSKVTDLIEVVGMGFTKKLLISGKLKNVLLDNRQDGVQFFQSGIYHKNTFIEDYWIINVFKINMEAIDFEKSEIFKTENVFNKINQLIIKNIFEFNKIKEEIEKEGYPSGILIERLKLKENITNNFFSLLHVEGGVKYIVSEKLKKEIENSGCTGVEFMPVEMRLTEWLQGGEREKVYKKA